MMYSSRQRQVAYAVTSFVLGAWAWIKINAVTGPIFEPIIEACQNPDISVEDFAAKTGYHEYNGYVGLGVFNVLVCCITQFLLELRETYPAGLLGWSGLMLVSLSTSLIFVTESGRKGTVGPIRYPVIMGLLYNLFGVSVVFPVLWIPSFIFGEGIRKSPLTRFRILSTFPLLIPVYGLLFVLFMAPTDSQLWTTGAGILGGPLLSISGLALYADQSSSLKATTETVQSTSSLLKSMHKAMIVFGIVGWIAWIAIAVQNYGASIEKVWDALWVNAGPSVKFMTIDMGVLYLAYLIFIGYRCGESKAIKAILLSFVVGPSAACSWVLLETEDETEYDYGTSDSAGNDDDNIDKKKD